MTGYTQGTIDKGKPVAVGVITDFVDSKLTDFIKKVITKVGHCLCASLTLANFRSTAKSHM